MDRQNFIRNIEDFACEHCGAQVFGSGYTNHCPNCLWSKHVDDLPGDRANPCGGLMEPIGVEVLSEGNDLVHKCQLCGVINRNKVADNDNRETLAAILSKQ